MLLPPDGRSLLTDVLRPPPGYRLDRAVATTFTLDLGSLLVAPIAFAAHGAGDVDDEMSILVAIQDCANRIDVFCQAGYIRCPPLKSKLLLVLEKMVHQVPRPTTGHLFHPKIWLVRYIRGGERLLRLIVLSRNLTGDRSWDVCLILDGAIGGRPSAANSPIAKLLRHVMGRTVPGLPEERRAAIDGLVEDARRAEWELPDGFREHTFYALGVPGCGRPDFDGTRHLVMAPFVEEGGLEICAPGQGSLAIIARQEELDRLSDDALEGCDVFVLSEQFMLDRDEELGAPRLTGLHAKTYVIEKQRRARVLVGSANATRAAYGGNVEFLVELVASKDQHGIDSMINDKAGLRAILEEYQRGPQVEPDPEEEIGRNLEYYLCDLAAVVFVAEVGAKGDLFEMSITAGDLPQPVGDLTLMLNLYTLSSEAMPIDPGRAVDVRFQHLSITAVTAFLVITATAPDGTSREKIVVADLIGDPPGRFDRVFADQIDTPEKFLEFMLLLLGPGPIRLRHPDPGAGTRPAVGGVSPLFDVGLLEMLLGALVTRPAQLAGLGKLIEQKAADPEHGVLPQGFLELWHLIDEARRDLQGNAAC
ncbi:hypothetical protein Acsp01_35160 [Actinoplanes sp. NBRC 101535]|nr:hypothetical protein Acsp01_35160 [Actinoplanes sp. NBRC 101535]